MGVTVKYTFDEMYLMKDRSVKSTEIASRVLFERMMEAQDTHNIRFEDVEISNYNESDRETGVLVVKHYLRLTGSATQNRSKELADFIVGGFYHE